MTKEPEHRSACVCYQDPLREASLRSGVEYDSQFGLAAPSMPSRDLMLGGKQHHREKDAELLSEATFCSIAQLLHAYSYVAKVLKPKEWRSIPEAVKVVQTEYDKLKQRGAWDTNRVREWKDVVAESVAKRKIDPEAKGPLRGMLFPICVVKHSEDPKKRKYKGRVVFQGNNIRDEFGLQEFFLDQGSGAVLYLFRACWTQ